MSDITAQVQFVELVREAAVAAPKPKRRDVVWRWCPGCGVHQDMTVKYNGDHERHTCPCGWSEEYRTR